MEPLKRPRHTATLAALFALSCTGEVGETWGPSAERVRRGSAEDVPGSTGTSAPDSERDGAVGPGDETPSDPGSVVARRLNHAEYDNSVRDLLGTELRPARDFPADDLGGGFDTVGSALSLSPAYVVAYEQAAHQLIDDLYADPKRRERVVSCDVAEGGDDCAREVLGAFARKAFRRPVKSAELDSLLLPVTTAQQLGASPEEGLRHALAAVLLSPYFLFKLELDPDPASATPRRLSPHELATRLSYTLWSSLPDDALSAAADAGELTTREQIGAQIDRMLADPRAESLLDTFAGQWLEYARLEKHEVEGGTFPDYSPALARSMQREARRFVQEFLRSSAPVESMLTARFTFVDAPLARHYGLAAPDRAMADELTRVDTSEVPRVGLLTLGALLTSTSFSARTSPVKRGDFLFTHLLCGSIPPPPADVPALAEDMSSLTLRERLEEHRKNPACAACHKVMDPLGFGLENYDAIGAYRTREGDAPINATGTLPDGSSFDGALELSAILAKDERFPRCVTRKFMTFATGRLLDQPEDERWVDYLTAHAQLSDGSLTSIIKAVLLSDVFLSRKPSP